MVFVGSVTALIEFIEFEARLKELGPKFIAVGESVAILFAADLIGMRLKIQVGRIDN